MQRKQTCNNIIVKEWAQCWDLQSCLEIQQSSFNNLQQSTITSSERLNQSCQCDFGIRKNANPLSSMSRLTFRIIRYYFTVTGRQGISTAQEIIIMNLYALLSKSPSKYNRERDGANARDQPGLLTNTFPYNETALRKKSSRGFGLFLTYHKCVCNDSPRGEEVGVNGWQTLDWWLWLIICRIVRRVDATIWTSVHMMQLNAKALQQILKLIIFSFCWHFVRKK